MKESILLVVLLLSAVHTSKIQLNSNPFSSQKTNSYIENEDSKWENRQEVRDHRFRFAHAIIQMIADSLRQVNKPTQSTDENINYQESVTHERHNPQNVEEEKYEANEEFRGEHIPQQQSIENIQPKLLLGENEYEHMPREIPSVAEARYMTQANLRLQQPQLKKQEGQEIIEDEHAEEEQHAEEQEEQPFEEEQTEEEQAEEQQAKDDQSNTLSEKAPAGTNEEWSDVGADLIRDEGVARMFFGEEEQRQSHSLQREDAATGEYIISRQISPDEESALAEEEEGIFKTIRP